MDSGFYIVAAVAAVEQNPNGTPSGVTVYSAVEKGSHHKAVADLLPQPEPPSPGPDASAKEQMGHRLQTASGQAPYRLRKQTVEPVFGIIEEVMGFRRFMLQGRAKVALEWTLVCLNYNLKRLFTLKNQAAAGENEANRPPQSKKRGRRERKATPGAWRLKRAVWEVAAGLSWSQRPGPPISSGRESRFLSPTNCQALLEENRELVAGYSTLCGFFCSLFARNRILRGGRRRGRTRGGLYIGTEVIPFIENSHGLPLPLLGAEHT